MIKATVELNDIERICDIFPSQLIKCQAGKLQIQMKDRFVTLENMEMNLKTEVIYDEMRGTLEGKLSSVGIDLSLDLADENRD